MFININKLTSESSFLKAEQTCVAQSFLIGEMSQTLYHLCGPPLDSLQEILVFFVLGSPELDTVLQARPYQGRVEGKDWLMASLLPTRTPMSFTAELLSSGPCPSLY